MICVFHRVPMTVHESPSLMYGQLRVINIVPIDMLHYIAIFWGSKNSQTRQAISLQASIQPEMDH